MTDLFPLAPEQRSVAAVDEIYGPRIQHNIVMQLKMPVHLDDAGVASVLRSLVAAHPSLGSVVSRNGLQSLLPGRIPLSTVNVDEAGLETELARLRDLQISRGHGPRAHACILESGSDRSLALAIDHMLCDDAGRTLVRSELQTLFENGAIRGEDPNAYRTFCEQASSAPFDRELQHWDRALRDISPHRHLTPRLDQLTPDNWEAVDIFSEKIDYEVTRQILSLLDRTGLRIFDLVSAALALSLLEYTNRPGKYAFTTPVSNRAFHKAEGVLCNQVSERPVAYEVDESSTLLQLARDIRASAIGAVRYARAPFDYLCETSAAFGELYMGIASEYIQLQCGFVQDRPGIISEVSARSRYEPNIVGTCTVFRVQLSDAGIHVSVFYGGPPRGHTWIAPVVLALHDRLTTAAQAETP